MDHNGSQTYEGLDDIEADHVTINQGGAVEAYRGTIGGSLAHGDPVELAVRYNDQGADEIAGRSLEI